MVSVNRILKFLWLLSVLFFIANLFYGYYILTDVVAIRFDPQGNPLEYTSRKNVFYFSISLIALFNVLIILIEKAVLMVPARVLPIPNKESWLKDQDSVALLRYTLSGWVYSFAFVFNLCICISFFIFWRVNSDFHKNIVSFNWVFPVIAGILVLWIIYLPVRLIIGNRTNS